MLFSYCTQDVNHWLVFKHHIMLSFRELSYSVNVVFIPIISPSCLMRIGDCVIYYANIDSISTWNALKLEVLLCEENIIHAKRDFYSWQTKNKRLMFLELCWVDGHYTWEEHLKIVEIMGIFLRKRFLDWSGLDFPCYTSKLSSYRISAPPNVHI